MNKVTLVIIATLAILIAAVVGVIALARGYQFDLSRKSLLPTGILVATSDPDGAEVIISGKLQTATNNTINLPPARYLVKIVKDGFFPWQKDIEIKREEVFKTNVFLFPSVPDLRPLTLTGAINPSPSPDNVRIAYGVASASADKNGVWIVDTGRSFTPASLLSGADFRQIYKDTPGLVLSNAKFLWSPDSKEIIAYFGANTPTLATPKATLAVLLETDRANDQPTFITSTLASTLSQWEDQNNLKTKAQWSKLDTRLSGLLATTSSHVRFSPDESKLLYQATAAASLPLYLSTYLPGTNPTPQTRRLTPGNTYVYDIKEDRNYLVSNCGVNITCSWFPSSRHLLSSTDQEISITEYDGTNKATVFSGPFKSGILLPWPNWSKIVILTSLNNVPGAQENLYTINLR